MPSNFRGKPYGRSKSPLEFHSLFGLRRRNIILVSWCRVCKKDGESVDHLFLHCPVALDFMGYSFQSIWDLVCDA